jgi:membrane protein implicated in regulation of membrane protease activity
VSVSFVGFLNNWWNLPFLVMLGLVGVFFLLQVIGLATHGDSDVDADGGDADADADHDADHDGDHDADHDAGGLWQGVISFFGIGRVPFMVVWVTFFIFAGFSGLTWNRVVSAGGSYPTWAFVAAMVIAIVVGALGVRLFSRLAAKLVDVGGRGSVKKHELCGKVGVVASATVDDKFGEVRVRDDRGNEMLIHGRLQPGEAALKRGDKLVLVDYDADKELFWVAAVPENIGS